MPAKSAERKKELKASANELAESLAAFVLPDSLPCSEVNFPVLIKRKAKANWSEIIQESGKHLEEIREYEDSKIEDPPKSPFISKFPIYYLNLLSYKLICNYIHNTGFICKDLHEECP